MFDLRESKYTAVDPGNQYDVRWRKSFFFSWWNRQINGFDAPFTLEEILIVDCFISILFIVV